MANIARTLNCHRAAIYRELKRNKQVTEYCPDKAQRACLIRRKTAAKYRIPSKTIDFIRILIEIHWSPEQVSNVLKNCGIPVSHEWIYQYIHDDKRNKGTLYRHLRQAKKRYRKVQRTKAEVIRNKVSIDEHPAIVGTKKRFGDWEIDTALGKHGTGPIVTLLERKTRFYLIKRGDSSDDRVIDAF